jgi:hypothetical protein
MGSSGVHAGPGRRAVPDHEKGRRPALGGGRSKTGHHRDGRRPWPARAGTFSSTWPALTLSAFAAALERVAPSSGCLAVQPDGDNN